MQQGWNLLHARELIWHSHEDLGAVETTHLHTKELKSARGRDPYPRLPLNKGRAVSFLSKKEQIELRSRLSATREDILQIMAPRANRLRQRIISMNP